MNGWLQGLRGRLTRLLPGRAARPESIPDALWHDTLQRYPFLAALDEARARRLRALCARFLRVKEFHAVAPLVLTDSMALDVAAQACLPVVDLDLRLYDGFVGIVLHEDEVVAPRQVQDDDGVVHVYDEVLSGEAMEGGPVMLSWRDVRMAAEPSADDDAVGAYNVVIHEFVHVIDMADGDADGVPPLPSAAERQAWLRVIEAEYDAFCDAVDRGDEVDLDPYAAEHPSEFFAVAAEAYFVAPQAFALRRPRLSALFDGYFRRPGPRR
jgi:Mlc titration factor MtfA (ptsG expression regulator)